MSNRAVLVGTFALALVLRLAIIAASPRVNDNNTDLEIYRAGGALVHAGINPYDPRDGVDLRARMRADTISPTFKLTQAFWDYAAQANLPFNLLVFGAIDSVSHSALAYRTAFAIADSLFAALAMAFVLSHWRASAIEALISGLALGACSLVMLQWGTHSPQDKGLEIVLMAGALLLTMSPNRVNRVVLGALVLGLSVAFKAVGVLLLPLCFELDPIRWTG